MHFKNRSIVKLSGVPQGPILGHMFFQLLTRSISFYLQPVSSKRHKLACAPIEDSDQPAHLRCLIRVVDGRSMGSQRPNVSSGEKLRL